MECGGEALKWGRSAGPLHPSLSKSCSWFRIRLHLGFVAWLLPLYCCRSARVARQQSLPPGCGTERVGLGVANIFCIFLQLEPQHQPWAYSGGLLQEPCEQGGDADAGGPGNVLIGELGSLVWVWGVFWVPGPGLE